MTSQYCFNSSACHHHHHHHHHHYRHHHHHPCQYHHCPCPCCSRRRQHHHNYRHRIQSNNLGNNFFAACDPNPCLHGGTCHERPGEPEGFICECPQHFFGLKCENVSKGTVLIYHSSIHNVDSYFFSNYYFSVSQIIEQNSAFSF